MSRLSTQNEDVQPKIILFDLDDTIVDSERIYIEIYHHLKLDLSLFEKARALVKKTLPGGHVAARNRGLYFKKYLELRNEFSSSRWISLMAEYEKRLEQLMEENLKKTGHRDLLAAISRRYVLGIVTNENLRTQMLKLNAIDPRGEFFAKVLVSEETGFEKPSPELIREAVEAWPHHPSAIMMVGDSVTNDLIPFANFGCQVVGTRQFRDESAAGNDFVWINRLEELPLNL